jgi:hypothetical protein
VHAAAPCRQRTHCCHHSQRRLLLLLMLLLTVSCRPVTPTSHTQVQVANLRLQLLHNPSSMSIIRLLLLALMTGAARRQRWLLHPPSPRPPVLLLLPLCLQRRPILWPPQLQLTILFWPQPHQAAAARQQQHPVA